MPESTQTQALAPSGRPPTLASHAWIDATPDGLVAFLLVAPSAAAAGAEDVAALASAIGLAGPQDSMPDVGERVALTGTRAVLQIPEIGRSLRVSVTAEWARLVGDGGTVVILLAADPLAAKASKAAVDQHLRAATKAGRIWLGKALQGEGTTWVACGECDRCLRGVGQDVDPAASDCYDDMLVAATQPTRRSA